MSRKFRFAHAPPPAPDEILGSWVARVAGRHGVPVMEFLRQYVGPGEGRADLDWTAPPPLIAWLGHGSGISHHQLASMTLSKRFPGARRDDFAWSRGPAFVGRHAYCPVCSREEVGRFGTPISRCADAGLWRLACREHRVLLHSVRGPEQASYSRRPRKPGRPFDPAFVDAPAFVLLFERAVARALEGRSPGVSWQVRDPVQFLDMSVRLASLVLVQRRPAPTVHCAASALLGDDALTAEEHGDATYDVDLIRRVASYARVRAFAAASLLLLTRKAALRLRVLDWAKLYAPFSRPSLIVLDPWSVAAEAWGRRTLEKVVDLAAGWPGAIKEQARTAARERLRLMGAL